MLQENRFKDAEALIREAIEKQPDLPGAAYELESSRSAKATMAGLGTAPKRIGAESQTRRRVAFSGRDSIRFRQAGGGGRGFEAGHLAQHTPSRILHFSSPKSTVDQQRLGLAEDTVRRAIQVHPAKL